MPTYLYILLGVLIVLIMVLMLVIAGIIFFKGDLILKNRYHHKHKSSL
ncbi:MAG: hypothetical protein ACM34K_16655 [Bacillota bacterium]